MNIAIKKSLALNALQVNKKFLACQFELHASKTVLVGMEYIPWYIKPCLVHWWDQFFDIVLQEDGERWRQMFKVLVSIFYYMCELVNDDLKTHPPLDCATSKVVSYMCKSK